MLNASPSSPAANFFAKVNGLSGSSEATKEDGDAWTGGLGRPSIETGGGTDESGRQPGDVRRAVSLRVQGSLGGFRPLREPIGMSFGAAGSNLSASPLSTTTGSTTLRSSSSSYAPPAASRHPLFSHHASPPIRPFEDQDGMSEATLSGISTPPSPSGSVGSSGFSPASAFLSHFSSSGSLRSNSTETAIDAQGARVLDYTLGKLIGRGGFSAVRKAHHVVTGEVFACKIVKRDDLSDSSGSVEKFEEEIRIWQAFPKHPSILPLLEMHRTPTVTFLIVPFLPGGSLLDVLKRENGSDRTARKFFPGVVTAVSALHEGYPGFEGKLLHGDLKLDNFLVDHVGNVIAGLPKEIDGLPHPVLPSASLPYAPPELLRAPPSPPSLAQDIWAVGIVLHALLTGRLPFFDAYDPRLQMKILKGTYAEP
ncbi:kinase-like domain-containing protein, partial [Kockovaella imperatae]